MLNSQFLNKCWAVIVCPPQGRRKCPANDTSERRNVSLAWTPERIIRKAHDIEHTRGSLMSALSPLWPWQSHCCQADDLVKDAAYVTLSVQCKLRNSDRFNTRQDKRPRIHLSAALTLSTGQKHEAAGWISILSHNRCLRWLHVCECVKVIMDFFSIFKWTLDIICTCLIVSLKGLVPRLMPLWFPQLQFLRLHTVLVV